MRRKETGGRSQENTNTGGRRQELGARRIQIQESGDRSKESGEYNILMVVKCLYQISLFI